MAFALREIHQISKAQKELNCPIHLLYCPLPLKSISSLRFVDLFNTLKRIFIPKLSNVSTTVTNLVSSVNHWTESWTNWKAVRIHFWWNATPSYSRSYYTTFLYCRRSSEPLPIFDPIIPPSYIAAAHQNLTGSRNIAGSQILTLILILGGPWSFWWFSLIRAKMLSLTSDNKRNTCPLFFFLFLRGGAVIRLIKTKHLQFFLTSFYSVLNHDSWSYKGMVCIV